MTVPRPNRAHGRPGTRVVPVNFERDHAHTIALSFTATGRVWPAATGPATINDDLSYTPASPASALYEGGMRLQELARTEVQRLFGDEFQTVTVYRVVLDLDAAGDISRGDRIEVTHSSDMTLSWMTIARVTRGSIRMERDVYAVDDQTRRSTAA